MAGFFELSAGRKRSAVDSSRPVTLRSLSPWLSCLGSLGPSDRWQVGPTKLLGVDLSERSSTSRANLYARAPA